MISEGLITGGTLMELVAFQLSDPWLTIVFVLLFGFLTYLMYAIYNSDRPSD